MNLTAKEDAVLKAVLQNEYTRFNGSLPTEGYAFDCFDFQVWVDCIADSSMRGKTLSGTISSLSKKGLVVCDGECVTLTRLGFDRAFSIARNGFI